MKILMTVSSILLCMTFLNCHSRQPERERVSELQRLGLKGNVYSTEEWIYIAEMSDGKIVPGDLTSISEYDALLGFAQNDRHISTVYDESGVRKENKIFSSDQKLLSKSVPVRNDNGNINILNAYDDSNNLTVKFSYENHDADSQYHKVIAQYSNGYQTEELLEVSKTDSTEVHLWKVYVSGIYTGYNERKFHGHNMAEESLYDIPSNLLYQTFLSYGSDNWISQIEYKITPDSSEPYRLHVFYEYTDIDDSDNWTKKLIYISESGEKPSAPQYIIIRTIGYYPESK